MGTDESGAADTALNEGTRGAVAPADARSLSAGSAASGPKDSEDGLTKVEEHERDFQRALNDWGKSSERRTALRAIAVLIGVPGIFSLIIAVLGFFFNVRTIGGHPYYLILIGGGAVTLVAIYASVWILILRRKRYLDRRIFELEDSRRASPLRALMDEVGATNTLSVTSETKAINLQTGVLWADTVERLDRYHKLVTSQADTSYLMAQIAAAAGFLILLSAAVVAAFAHTNLASGVAGGLGALGAGIAAYIGKTFQRSYEQATNRLLAYFQQPLDLSRILISERLLDHLSPTAKDEAVLVMIASKVSGGKEFPERPVTRQTNGTDKA